jgi:RNA polymerase sigma factor (sigma-70 family)
MEKSEQITQIFEESRGHLRSVAYRMLGSLAEAEDAVQEAWFRLNRSDVTDIENIKGWLTTVVARLSLDMLRSRKSRREEEITESESIPAVNREKPIDPEEEALMADSVGLALLVVLGTLAPAERLAFVMHEMFDVPFDEIARITGRSAAAARQLASRARRRVKGAPKVPPAELNEQRGVVKTFLTALKNGDFNKLLTVLDPNLIVRADAAVVGPGGRSEVRGAENWAKGAVAFSRMARFIQSALVDGKVGIVMAPKGRLTRVLTFTIADGLISEIDVIGDAQELDRMEIGMLTD